MSFVCTHCQAPIADASVDRAREIATCGACARLVDLRSPAATLARPASAAPPQRLRAPVALPAGMAIRAEAANDGFLAPRPPEIVIERRWLRGKHYVLLAIFLALSSGAALLWAREGLGAWLVIGTIVLASWNYNLLTMFVNRTVIRAGRDSVDVKHGPLPSVFFRPQSVPTRSVRQLFAAGQGGRFLVKAKLADGGETTLVWPLISAEQAIFIEQQLEHALGLVDYEVAGELGASLPAAVGAPGGKAGSGGAVLALLVPALVGGILLLFFVMSASEVTGSFTAKGKAGAWTFTPDDCRSGQLSGFSGVELSSSADPDRVIRLSRDAVRGNLVIVDARGASRPTLVLEAAACERLDMNVDRTSTSINDVWVVEGKATIACGDLAGEVTFAGCH